MGEQLTAFRAWWTAAAPAMTGVLGGSMALGAALLFFLLAAGHRPRFFVYFATLSGFVRGMMPLTTLGAPKLAIRTEICR